MAEAITDAEAEYRLLSPLLYGTHESRFLGHRGPQLSDRRERISAFLRMQTGKPWSVGVAEPPTACPGWVFLPDTLAEECTELLADVAYRCMATLQAQYLQLGLLENTAWLSEIHRDRVLQNISQLLMANWVVKHWKDDLPGLYQDTLSVRQAALLTRLRVGAATVQSEQLPPEFLTLLSRLTSLEGPTNREQDHWLDQVVDATPAALSLTLPGVAQRFRESFLKRQIGAPPLPYWIGELHPSWFLFDEVAAHRRANEWRSGPSPLKRLISKIQGSEPVPSPLATEHSWAQAPTKGSAKNGVYLPEWDHRAGGYRREAIRVITEKPATGSTRVVDTILRTDAAQINTIRAQFAALTSEARWLHRQHDGQTLDLDAVVNNRVSQQSGSVTNQRIFKRFASSPASICVLTLVDLSGSTKGAMLAEQRRAVVYFTEGLTEISVPHAFLGFNGTGPQDCRSHLIKNWDDNCVDMHKRIAGMSATGGSRLGAHIRHAMGELHRRHEARKVLVVLSDGRPEDGDAYRGAYGIADTAMAVREARGTDLAVHCICLDDKEAPYLRLIFGPGGYTQVADAALLGQRLADAFCGLIH